MKCGERTKVCRSDNCKGENREILGNHLVQSWVAFAIHFTTYEY